MVSRYPLIAEDPDSAGERLRRRRVFEMSIGIAAVVVAVIGFVAGIHHIREAVEQAPRDVPSR